MKNNHKLRAGVMALGILLGIVTGGASQATQAAQVTRYDILNSFGKKMGEQIVTRADGGLVTVHFIFKDNGRGPELDEEFHLAADGTVKDYHVKGSSTFGAPVDEYFSRKGDQAEWHSTSEKGSTTVSGTGLYVPLNSSFEFAGVSFVALAKRADGKLPLLPSGTLTQRKLDDISVTAGGNSRRVQLIAQFGVGLSPAFGWATPGPNPRLFAVVVPGQLTLIEQGWEKSVAVLEARQKIAETKLLADLATQLQHPMDGLTVIRNARVFDSEKAELTAASDVYVLRGKIAAVLPAGSPVRGANNEIDAAGRVMLPGLFDMHTHNARWDGGLHLAAGVTTVRDMGNNNAQLQQMIDEIAAGQVLAPQIWPAGFLEGESKFSASGGFVVKDLEGAKSAIDWYAEHGYRHLKIYNSFPRAILADTTTYAHARGMRVSGHVPAFMRAEEVVEQGYDEIQHINQVMLNFLVTPETDTRTLERFRLPAEKVADLNMDSQQVRDFVALLKRKHTVIDPTLAAFDFVKQKDGEMAAPYAAIAEHMPPDVRRSLYVGSMNIPDDATLQRYTRSYDKMVAFTGRMYREGIPLVAGTDGLAGFTLQGELEVYVKAGLTPAQALQVATLNGARYTGTSSERGSIAAGKFADLILVDGEPTTNISDIRKVALVVTRGKLLYPHEIDQALGIRPFVQNPPVMRAIKE